MFSGEQLHGMLEHVCDGVPTDVRKLQPTVSVLVCTMCGDNRSLDVTRVLRPMLAVGTLITRAHEHYAVGY
jgi:hypothetical protein